MQDRHREHVLAEFVRIRDGQDGYDGTAADGEEFGRQLATGGTGGTGRLATVRAVDRR